MFMTITNVIRLPVGSANVKVVDQNHSDACIVLAMVEQWSYACLIFKVFGVIEHSFLEYKCVVMV